MKNSRRSFLKIAGISALGIGASPALNLFASSDEHGKVETFKNKSALTAGHWGMVIDTRKIKSEKDLEPIVEACNKIHNVPKIENTKHEIKWIWEEEYKHAFPSKENNYLDERTKHLPFPVSYTHLTLPTTPYV